MIRVAVTNPFGYAALAANPQIANDNAADDGRTMDAAAPRVAGPIHCRDARYGVRELPLNLRGKRQSAVKLGKRQRDIRARQDQ